jgi:hypothetical protein
MSIVIIVFYIYIPNRLLYSAAIAISCTAGLRATGSRHGAFATSRTGHHGATCWRSPICSATSPRSATRSCGA